MTDDLRVAAVLTDAVERQGFQVDGIEVFACAVRGRKDHLVPDEGIVVEIEAQVVTGFPGQAHHFVMRVLVDPFIGHCFLWACRVQRLRHGQGPGKEQGGGKEEEG